MMDLRSASEHGLLEINTFVVPADVVLPTIAFLQDVGRHGAEGFVLWCGQKETTSRFRFTSAYIPEQRAYNTEQGLLVVVEGEALFRANKESYERGEVLGGQVHTHPSSAYHSDTDDHYPLVTLIGALSLVIPNFAHEAPDDKACWAYYRLRDYGRWAPLDNHTQVVFEL
jgi:hypothetical protein